MEAPEMLSNIELLVIDQVDWTQKIVKEMNSKNY